MAALYSAAPCELYEGYYNDTKFAGKGQPDSPYAICLPEHINLIGNTGHNPDYALDKHYILGRDIDFKGKPANLIGGGCGTDNIFTGIFDGDGHRVFNYTFNSNQEYYSEDSLFTCNKNFKDDSVFRPADSALHCGLMKDRPLPSKRVSLESDNLDDYDYIVCSRAHLNTIESDLTASYVFIR